MASRFFPPILVPLVAALATCSFEPDGGGPDPYANLTTLELCLTVCPKWVECGRGLYECEKECATRAKDGTPACDAQFAAAYICQLEGYSRWGCDSWMYDRCYQGPTTEARKCAQQHGCKPDNDVYWCETIPVDQPPGTFWCPCGKTCGDKHFEASCHSGSPVSECECRIGSEVVGTCQGTGPEPVCDLYTSCCNQFFAL